MPNTTFTLHLSLNIEIDFISISPHWKCFLNGVRIIRDTAMRFYGVVLTSLNSVLLLQSPKKSSSKLKNKNQTMSMAEYHKK